MSVESANRRSAWCLLLISILVMSGCSSLFGHENQSRLRRTRFNRLIGDLARAQEHGDEKLVNRLAEEAKQLLGKEAGVPERPDQFREVPANVPQLSIDELHEAFDHYLREIKRRKWWSIGEDPTKSDHKPREVASVIIGCCSAYRADCKHN